MREQEEGGRRGEGGRTKDDRGGIREEGQGTMEEGRRRGTREVRVWRRREK